MSRYAKQIEFQTFKEAASKTYSVDKLKKLTRNAQVIDPPHRKDDLIRSLFREIKSKRVFALLDKKAKNAIAEALYAPGTQFNLEQFEAKYGSSPYKYDEYYDHKRYGDLVDLFIIDGHIPVDLRELLQGEFDKPQPDTIASSDTLAEEITLPEEYYYEDEPYALSLIQKETERAALQNLKAVLRLMESNTIAVSPTTRRPSATAVNTIVKVLSDGDWYADDRFGAIQSFAWPLLLQCAGLAGISGNKLALTAKGRKVLYDEIAAHECIKTVWNAWVNKGLIDEFNRIDVIKGQNAKGRVLSPVQGRRSVLEKVIKECPGMKWIALPELSRYMQATANTFVVANDPWKLYIQDPQYGSLGYDGFHSWNILQERYIKAVLMEYAATLGIIDIAYCEPQDAPCDFKDLWGIDGCDFLSMYDGLLYFRINTLGMYVLGGATAYTVQPETVSTIFEVLPTMEIILTDTVNAKKSDLQYLNTIAEKISDYQWRLTLRSVGSALAAGEKGETIMHFLQARSSRPLPAAVTPLFREAESRVPDLKFMGRSCLLACDNPLFITHTQSDPQLKETCLKTAERYLVILPGKEKKFVKRLQELGYGVPVAKDIKV